jgi:hypothetical protein
VQKKAIRIISKSDYNEHTAPLFIQHGILPFEKLIEQAKLLFMHGIEYNYAHKSFTNTWLKNNQLNIEREYIYIVRNIYFLHPG